MKFEDPPTAPDRFNAAAAELRAHPGRWAILEVFATSDQAGHRATTIRQGRARAFQPAGAYEATQRTVDGEVRLYARYVGNGDGP